MTNNFDFNFEKEQINVLFQLLPEEIQEQWVLQIFLNHEQFLYEIWNRKFLDENNNIFLLNKHEEVTSELISGEELVVSNLQQKLNSPKDNLLYLFDFTSSKEQMRLSQERYIIRLREYLTTLFIETELSQIKEKIYSDVFNKNYKDSIIFLKEIKKQKNQ